MAAALAAALAISEADASTPRILVVYSNHSTQPSNLEFTEGLEQALSATLGTDREVFSEYMDAARFPGPKHERRFAELLAAKYGSMKLDAVAASGPAAAAFVLRRREEVAPGAPVILANVTRETVLELGSAPDVGAVVSAFDVRATIDFARTLQPDAERIVVMTGSAPFDRRWRREARDALGERYEATPVSYVSGLTLQGFVDLARDLDRRTILLFLTIFEDASGRTMQPRDAARVIAETAGAPTYTIYGSIVGVGVVGGVVNAFDATGEAVGALVADALREPAAKPPVVEAPATPTVDWRQIERWDIDPGRVPQGTTRAFYTPGIWQDHKAEIVAAGAVMLGQMATIAALIATDRRRRRIAATLADERLELAHLSRSDQLNQLSGAIAHELNQPLTAIMANAEAGARLLAASRPDLAELAAILKDIAEDDRRAADIIIELRRLMTKDDGALGIVDLNDAVRSTTILARSELVARRTALDFRAERPELPVRGNIAQLEQVVLNLMLNAAEAMSDLPASARRIVVETRLCESGERELSVADRGPGAPPEMREAAFRPFVTTKRNGLGFGLSICRSIAQRHGGTLRFDDGFSDGARLILTLPAPSSP